MPRAALSFISPLVVLLFILPAGFTDYACSNKCAQADADRGCWNRTARYYEHEIARVINDYIVVLHDIDQWAYRHNRSGAVKLLGPKDQSAAAEFMLRSAGEFNTNFIGNRSTVDEIAKLIFQRFYDTRPKAQVIAPPQFQCPLPADYNFYAWRTLAICAIVLSAVLMLSLVTVTIFAEDSPLSRFRKKRAFDAQLQGRSGPMEPEGSTSMSMESRPSRPATSND